MLFEFKVSQIIVETDLKVNTPPTFEIHKRDELHCGTPETFTSLVLVKVKTHCTLSIGLVLFEEKFQ